MNRKIQPDLLIVMALILLSGCTRFDDEILPTGDVILNTEQELIDVIIKTNEKYKNMQDFRASKVINNDYGELKEVIMIKGDNYKKIRESFEEKSGWYVKNKIIEISDGNKAMITKTFEPSSIKELEEILENELISEPDEQTYIKLGRLYCGLGKVEEAEEMFKKAISINPNEPEGFIGLGLLYKSIGKTEEAEAILKRGRDIFYLNRDLNFLGSTNTKSTIRVSGVKAQIALNEVKKSNPNYQWRNTDIVDTKDYDEEIKIEAAKEIFEHASEIMPNNELFLISLGGIYRIQREFKKAEEMYNKVLSMNSLNRKALIELYTLYKIQGKAEKARLIFEKTVNTFPNDRFIYLRSGILSLYQEDEKEAEEVFKKAIDIDPSMDRAHDAIGEIYSFFDIRKTEEIWKEGISLRPGDPLLLKKLGWVYLNQRKVNDAEEMFKRSLNITGLPSYESKPITGYDEIQYINDILNFNIYDFDLKQDNDFYFLEGIKIKDTALWSRIKAEISKDAFSVTKLEFYKEVDGKEKLMKSIIYEDISFNNNFDEKEFAIIEE